MQTIVVSDFSESPETLIPNMVVYAIHPTEFVHRDNNIVLRPSLCHESVEKIMTRLHGAKLDIRKVGLKCPAEP
jgi:hypothetical protein